MARPEPNDRFQPYRECRQRIAVLRRLVREPPRHVGSVSGPPAPLVSPSRQEEQEWRRSYRTPVEEGEADESPDIQHAKQRKALKAVWRREVGPTPLCAPGDVQAARTYLDKLLDIRDRDSSARQERESDNLFAPLTRSEQGYLRMQIRKWEKRAKGEDARFNRVGNRAGRPRLRRVL